MPVPTPIDEASVRSVLQLLRRIQQPLSEEAARVLIGEQGWTVEADPPGEGVVASGTWPGAAETIMFTFADGQTRNFSISAFSAPTEGTTFATIRWYTHEDHDNLLRSMRDETYEGMLDDEE